MIQSFSGRAHETHAFNKPAGQSRVTACHLMSLQEVL